MTRVCCCAPTSGRSLPTARSVRPRPALSCPSSTAAPATDRVPPRLSAAREAVRTLYAGYFALVMATGIVSIAAALLDMPAVAWALFALNNGFYLILWVLTLARLALYPAAVVAD